MQANGMIFWDWNGTLMDDLDFTHGCLNWMLETHGYPQRYDLAAYREIFGFPIEEYYIRAGFDFARHPYPELAECFINFMLSREAAVANAEYIYYASPNRLVYDDPEYIDDMGEDTMAILYPDIGSFRDAYNRSAYRNLDQDTLTYVNSLWETLKIN